ncbi:MAG: hypothetical protein ABUL71_03065 [Gemmatimonadota bacterium]
MPTSAAPTTPVPVGQGYDLLPSGTTFTAPVTIKLKYNPASVPAGHAAGALQMRTQVGTAWNALADPIVIDSAAHTVTATTTHFSTYIVTDPRLTFGVRDGDVFTAIRASSANITICLGDTKRVVVLFYDQTLTTSAPAYTWAPGPWNLGLGSEVASPTAYGVGVTISGGTLGGPTGLVVTSNGESATLWVTVINCAAPAITYTRDFGGADNAYLYQNGGNSALTTDNNTSKSSTIATGLGAVGVYNSGSNRQVNYYGVGWNLRAKLQAPIYTTQSFLDAFAWVSPTVWEFSEVPPSGLAQLFRMNTDGTGKTPFGGSLTAGGNARLPYLAGNGFTYFSYAPPPGTQPTQLYRLDANGANLTQLLTVSGWAWTPTVSQDGQWVVISYFDVGVTHAQLLLYDLNNLQATPIAISPATGYAQYPSFCGNGVVYYAYNATTYGNPWTLYRWDMASRTSTPAAFVASGSIPEGVSVQPQKGKTDRSCPP